MCLYYQSIVSKLCEYSSHQYLWIKSDGSFGATFSSKVTWEHIRNISLKVYWSKTVWFKEHIPRTLLLLGWPCSENCQQETASVRWGLNVPELCVLCSTCIETHHHLFLSVSFLPVFGVTLLLAFLPNLPLDIHSASALISHAYFPEQFSPVMKLILQSAVYLIW